MDTSRKLVTTTSEAGDPVRYFESKIRHVLVQGGGNIEDSWNHETEYDQNGPHWVEQKAVDLNDLTLS